MDAHKWLAGIAVVAIALAGSVTPAAAAFTAAGVYDEQTYQTNAVDFVAGAAAGSEAIVIDTVAEYEAYKAAVASAFAAGTGGVLNFDENRWGEVSNGLAIDVLFSGGSKSLAITPSSTSGTVSLDGNLTNRKAISGGSGAANLPVGLPGGVITAGTTNMTFTVGALTGGDAGEIVGSFGATLLSRTSRDLGTVQAVATLDDSSTATASYAVGAMAAGTGDTFFGFVAPAGRSIASVAFTWSGDVTSFDDVAFTTVPEPATMALLAVGGLIAIRRRR